MALIEVLDPSYVKLKLDNLDLSLTGLRDALRGTGNKTLTDLDTDLANIYGRLDVVLSTRASETTLSGIKTQTDKLTFDASNYLQVNVKAIVNPSNLDVALSTRASESTLSGIKTQTDKLTFDANNYLQVNVKTTVNPPNLDVALSTRASESTLSTLSGKFPSAAALADNLGNPTTTIIGSALLGWDGTYWRRVATDTSSRLRAVVESVANPPNLDVALSTRASESTLSSIYGRLDVALSTRLADSKIPNVLGQVSTDVVGSTMYALAVLDKSTPSRMPYMVDNISVGTTSSSTSIAAPGGKIVKITNKGDVDVLIGINADVPASNPVVVRARTYKIFVHHSVTSIYYKVAAGSSTISIEWWN